MKDYDTLVSLIAGEDRKDKLVNGVIKPKKSSLGLGNMINSRSNTFKKQFVNGARKKNLVGECSSLSESEASVSDVTGPSSSTLIKKKLHVSGRKPLSYLFDSDSSADGGDDPVKDGGSKGKKPRKGKSPTSKGRQKGGGMKSSTSDSDELTLHLPVQKGGNNLGKSEGPIYSDSESDGSLKRRPGSPVATKAAVKEFTRKSNKKTLQGAMSVGQKVVPSTKQGKGPIAGRKKKGGAIAEPTGLIVPQREAAKKATESIRTVKQRKDGLIDPTTGLEFPSASSPAATLNDRESESFEKTAMEKFKDIAAASVQDKQIKKGNKSSKTTENKRGKKSAKSENASKDEEAELHGLYDELRDQYEFDCSNDSKNVPNFVPQRQGQFSVLTIMEIIISIIITLIIR